MAEIYLSKMTPLITDRSIMTRRSDLSRGNKLSDISLCPGFGMFGLTIVSPYMHFLPR